MKPNSSRSGPRSLWRNRDYLLLQSGQVVSSLGDQQQFIALPLLILALTGSPLQAGLAVSAERRSLQAAGFGPAL